MVGQRESWASVILPVALIVGLVLLLRLDPGGGPAAGEAFENPLEPWLKIIVSYLAVIAEIAAALVIGVAVLRGIARYLATLLMSSATRRDVSESIRLQLGRVLALGLEFTVASDILRTAVAPTRQDILTLGAIVMLRTLLNYFLEREIRQGEESRAAESARERNEA